MASSVLKTAYMLQPEHATGRDGSSAETAARWLAQAPVWRVSWSVTGSVLSVSDSTGGVTLWKEALDGEWQQLSN